MNLPRGHLWALGALCAAGVALWLRIRSLAIQTGNAGGPESEEAEAEEPTMLDGLQADASALVNRVAGYDAASMSVSDAGRDAIRSHEALKLTRYRLGDGGWTIGWGRYYPDSGAAPPETITRAQADAWFDEDLEQRGARWVRAYVTAPLTQSQFDALVSMAYNLSPKSFRTIAEAVNRGDDPEEAAMVFTRPGTNLERGLRNRRGAELALYRAEGIAGVA